MAENTAPIAFMKRYELKYLLSADQRAYLERELEGRLFPDRYGETAIASLYYDTPDFRLIRASVEKPAYKEKLRLRSYGPASDTSPVFLEMKRKAYGLVYKRRVQSTIPQVKRFFDGVADICAPGQINAEIRIEAAAISSILFVLESGFIRLYRKERGASRPRCCRSGRSAEEARPLQ